jgi:DNA-binding transcriptional ArsR family regulator
MKRDMELIRTLLRMIESQPPGQTLRSPKVEGYDQGTVFSHLELLSDAGLIEAHFMKDRDMIGSVVVERLTWQGHEFISAASNESVWQKAKEKIAEFGGAMPLPVLQALLIEIAKKQIGL